MIPPFKLISPFILQYINEENLETNLNTKTKKSENDSHGETSINMGDQNVGEIKKNTESDTSKTNSETKNQPLIEPLKNYCWKLKSFIGAPCIKYAYHCVKINVFLMCETHINYFNLSSAIFYSFHYSLMLFFAIFIHYP